MDVVRELSLNPAVQAVAIKLISDVVKGGLQKIDSAHVADHYGKYLQGTLVVLTGIVGFLTMVVQGHASNFDPSPLIQYMMTLYVAALTVDQGVEAAKAKLVKKDQ